MQTVQLELIKGKKVLLRLDLDVPIKDGQILEDFRLKAALPTLDLCLEHAQSVIVMGHVGRPKGEDPALSVKPIVDWLENEYSDYEFPEGKLHVLENLRFEAGEDGLDLQFAKELAALGNFYINDAFAAHHPAASTTLLPKLLPHAMGLHFAHEIETLKKIRENPERPLVVIIGGAKIEDKLPAIIAMSKIADAVLVGGKLPEEIDSIDQIIPSNVMIGKLNEAKTDIADETTQSWEHLIKQAKMILWSGPVGLYENSENDQTQKLAQMITNSSAQTIIGGGDTLAAASKFGLINQFTFVSLGGGAMLEFLEKGTLATIQALE